jgi:glutamine amidotransferase
MRFSFRGLTRRGGATGEHADGWGLASFDPQGGGLRVIREESAAAFSPLAAQMAEHDLKALYSLAHIRKATQGVVALENCHPFHRRWRGREWVFAHNGNLLGPLPGTHLFRPEGSTDSEIAFCWILEQLNAADADPEDLEATFATLVDASRRLEHQGTFNCLISNGSWLFAHASSRLHRITRRSPFGRATLADDDLSVDFSELAGVDDVVTIVSTEPLTTDEEWLPLQAGEAVLLVDGEVMQRQPPDPVTSPIP